MINQIHPGTGNHSVVPTVKRISNRDFQRQKKENVLSLLLRGSRCRKMRKRNHRLGR